MPLPSTMTPIATNTLVSAAASVTFSNIPQGYTDLVLIYNGGASASGDIGYLQFNSDTGSNYSSITLYGNGTTATSAGSASNTYIAFIGRAIGMSSTLVDNAVVNIMNYSNSITNKTVISRSNIPAGGTAANVGVWLSTSSITSVTFTITGGRSWLASSSFTLYGIKAA